jgi:hypothetical protein
MGLDPNGEPLIVQQMWQMQLLGIDMSSYVIGIL